MQAGIRFGEGEGSLALYSTEPPGILKVIEFPRCLIFMASLGRVIKVPEAPMGKLLGCVGDAGHRVVWGVSVSEGVLGTQVGVQGSQLLWGVCWGSPCAGLLAPFS